MISQPMRGKIQAEINATREKAISTLEDAGYEVVNTLFTDDWGSQQDLEEQGVVQIPLAFLAKALGNMSRCHAVYFCDGWMHARGCQVEHLAAQLYELRVIYEKE